MNEIEKQHYEEDARLLIKKLNDNKIELKYGELNPMGVDILIETAHRILQEEDVVSATKDINESKMKVEEIDWHNQALEFLKLHGWYQDKDNPFNPEAWSHRAFPLMEDLSASGNSPEEFAEKFYGESWKVYKAYVRGVVIMTNEEIKKEEEDDMLNPNCSEAVMRIKVDSLTKVEYQKIKDFLEKCESFGDEEINEKWGDTSWKESKIFGVDIIEIDGNAPHSSKDWLKGEIKDIAPKAEIEVDEL